MNRLGILKFGILTSCLVWLCIEPLAANDDRSAAIHDIPFETAFQQTRIAADAGNVEDQVRLGKFYEKALGVEQNLSEALSWYRRAAESGSTEAALALGKLLQNADLPEGRREAREPWLRRVAETGSADGQVALARFLMSATANRRTEADEWLERAAQQGHPVAMAMTGMRLVKSSDPLLRARGADYLSGAANADQRLSFFVGILETTKRKDNANDIVQITDALHQSAISVDLEQQVELGSHPFVTVVVLSGMARMSVTLSREGQQIKAAKDNLKTAAESGHLQASCNLGFLHLITEDFASAFEWYHKAAQRGSARAAYRLGVLYRDGLGVQAEPSRAVTWFHRAAIQMYPPAQAALGDMLLNGTGVAKDFPAAIAWLRPAAAYGVRLAQYDLGLMYDRGLGLKADPDRALTLMAKASAGSWEISAVDSQELLLPPQSWLRSAQADPQRRDAVRGAIAKVQKSAMKIPSHAPFDCMGRPWVFDAN